MGKAKSKKSNIPKYLSAKPEKEIAKPAVEEDAILPSKRELRKQKKEEKKKHLQEQIEQVEQKKVVKRKKKKPIPESFISFAKDIASSLPQNTEENALRNGKKAKNKEALVNTEVEQFNNVLEHPVFKADPLAAIREHLTN